MPDSLAHQTGIQESAASLEVSGGITARQRELKTRFSVWIAGIKPAAFSCLTFAA
jgi:hypothetical protein